MNGRTLAVAMLTCAAAPSVAVAQMPVESSMRFPSEAHASLDLHPEPRAYVNPFQIATAPANAPSATREAYRIASEIPEVLDGIHTFCQQGRSLLGCFERGGPAADSPLTVSVTHLVYTMYSNGHSLETIRRRLDGMALTGYARRGQAL